MERREFLFAGAASAAVLAARPVTAFAQGALGRGGDAQVQAVLDRTFANRLLHSPETATELGMDKGVRARLKFRLNDRSAAGMAAQAAYEAQGLAELKAIDPATLSQAGQRHLAVGLYRAEARLAPVRFGIDSIEMPFAISQQNGAYYEVPDMLANQHVIETADDAEAYLARLQGMAIVLDDQSEVQREAASRGWVAPPWALDLALGQMRDLRDGAPESNPVVASLADRAAAKGLAGDWRGRAAKILTETVFPALDRQMAVVERSKRSAPDGDGAWRLRRGREYYAEALRTATTTDLSAEEIHHIGLTQVAELQGQLDGVLKAAGFTTGSVGERLTALNRSPEQVYPNTDEGRAALIAGLNAGVEGMRARLPQAFGQVPGEPLEIRRVPPEIQNGAPNGYYYSAALDGSRPAIYWINLKSTADWPKYQLPSLTYHEGVPGHHLQGGYARLDRDLPLLLQNYFLSSYGEGWALYAEQLADELGGYEGIERAGYLQSFLFRATRLVVDTGIHAKRWSRAQATRYMVETTGFTAPRSQREIDRYCTMVGQACSYKIGHNKWIELRSRAQAKLGAKFSLPWFHEVLREGVMPLSLLDKRVDERIAERLAAG